MTFTINAPIQHPFQESLGYRLESNNLPRGEWLLLYQWDLDETLSSLTHSSTGEKRYRLQFGIDWRDIDGSIRIEGGSVDVRHGDTTIARVLELPKGKFPTTPTGQLTEEGWITSGQLGDLSLTLSFNLEGEPYDLPVAKLPPSCCESASVCA